jgi:dTDP-4-dehydrorhamnose reductase
LEAFSYVRPDVVVNAAAWTDVDKAEAFEQEARTVNAIGPQLIAQAAAKYNSTLIQISTDYVFSGKSKYPWDETSKTHPSTAYGRTKAEGEKLVLATWAEKTLILRTAWLYSPWKKNFVKTILKKAINDSGDIQVVDDQIGQPTSAQDLAVRIQLMLNGDLHPGIYHATNSGSTSWFDLAMYLFEYCDADLDRVKRVSSLELNQIANRPLYSVLGHNNWKNIELAPMRPWHEAIDDALPSILSSMKENGEILGN